MNNYPAERSASIIFIENTKLLRHWLETFEIYSNVPQQFVEMLLLQNKQPWLVRYKKVRATVCLSYPM